MADHKEINTSVFVYGEPTCKTIVPTSGKNEGKETPVLNVKAYRPCYEKDESGKFVSNKDKTEFFTVSYYGAKANDMVNLIKDGMRLDIQGSVTQNTFKTKDGQERTENVINAKQIGVSLIQLGLKNIDYEKPFHEKNQTKSQGKELEPEVPL